MKNKLHFRRFYETKIGVLFLFFVFPFVIINAQNKSFSNKQFVKKDGLSQVTINDMIEDDLGFVWIATDHGLNRFDGSTFKTFVFDDTDSTSLGGNLVNTLFKDKKGNVWNGCSDGGLSYFDPILNHFKRINFKNNRKVSISDITGGSGDDLWIGTKDLGLFRIFYGKNGRLKHSQFFSNLNISALYFKDNYLWLGDYNGNVYQCQFEDDNFKILNEFKIDGQVRSFLKINRDLIIGTDESLFKYAVSQKEVTKLNLENEGKPIKYLSHLILKDRDNIWIATADGLHVYNITKNKLIQSINNSPSRSKVISNNTILSLLELPDQTLLVGTANGLNMLSFKPPIFKNISKDLSLNNLLNDNVIFSILKDKEDLWIGTSEGGLNYINGNKVYYIDDTKDNENFISGTIRDIIKDQLDNRIWIATTRGLSMIDLDTFDPESPEVLTFKNNVTDSTSLPFNYIKGLAIDQNNNIWGATYGMGVFMMEYSESTDVKFTKYLHKEQQNSISNNFTTSIRIDSENNVWIGSESGLTKIVFSDRGYNNYKITNYKNNQNDPNSLVNNTVNDILLASDNRVWLATHKGISVFDGENFKSWDAQEQYDDPVTYLVEEDNDGNIWLGTNDGLLQLDIETDKFSRYSTDDGIKHNEFDTHARDKDEKGNIYLGGLGGVTYFNPESLKNVDDAKPLYFSELRIKNRITAPPILDQNIFSKEETGAKKLVFNHDEFPFYLKFSSLDFSQNKNTKFAYRILPLSNEWNAIKNSEIQFLNSPVGDFTLQVNGFSRGVKWDQNPLEISFEVLPRWWATWWAYICYAFLLGFVIYQIYNFKFSQKLASAESDRLKEIGALKNLLYTNITHEFRTPLTVIQGMTQVLESKLEDKDKTEAKSSIQMIKRSGNTLLKLVNEMLDLAKVENGEMSLDMQQSDIIPYLKYLSESFNLFAKEKGIKIMIYAEVDSLVMDFDPPKMTTIISNLLTNAVNFSKDAGRVIFHINKTVIDNEGHLTIKIQDNGTGIAEDKLKNLFSSYYKIGEGDTGSGIGLALTKEMIKLMNGDISVVSEIGIGSTFTMNLPITNVAEEQSDLSLDSVKEFEIENTVYENGQMGESKDDQALILIIEDNEDVAYYLESCLKNDYKVIHAIDGAIGVEKALENVPDIIISDVMMPYKNGFEVCQELKSNEITDHIPIILLTAKATIEDKIEGLSSGADAYLAKPFVKEELLTRIAKLISFRSKMIEKFKKDDLNKLIVKPPKSVESKFIKKAIEVIIENLENENFGASQLATILCLSDSQLYRKLKSLTDKSTAVFIRSIRLQKAKELIITTDKPISDVAYDVGFNDPSWFSRVFKDEFYVAPSSLRK